MEQIERGDEVKCQVTGFQGIVTTESYFLQGQRRLSVQPPVDKEGKIPDAYEIDEMNLMLVARKKAKAQPPVKIEIKLGDEVEDPITGFKGVVTVTSLFLNGCTRVAVTSQAQRSPKDGKSLIEGFDVGRLKLVKKEKVTEGQRRTGGPMERITPTKSGAW